jgi:regulator of sigma E protease
MIAVFAAVLGTMVVVHEFGHFIVAKFFGIRVEIFSVGFGKRLWGFKRGDTDYRLSLIPLGGYVKMSGENLDEQVTGAPYEFMSKPKWQRFCVAIAGPVMNILMALAIPAITSMIHYEIAAFTTKPAVVNAISLGSAAESAGLQRGDLIVKINGLENPTWQDVRQYEMIHPDQEIPVVINRDGQIKELKLSPVGQQTEFEKIGYAGLEPYYGSNTKLIVRRVAKGSPAEAAGLKDGDQILAVNGRPVRMDAPPSEATAGEQGFYGQNDVIRYINTINGQEVALTVKRGDETVEIKGTPKLDPADQKWKLGFQPTIEGVDAINTRLGPVAAIKYAYATNMKVLELTWMAISQIFEGKRSARDSVMGPVGIFRVTGEAAEQGFMPVLQLTALLSLNLGIFNLLPIPVLDGGLIFMLGLEALLGLFGLPLSLRIKERMVQVGFVMLLLLMGFVIFNDISRYIPGRSAPPAAEQQTQQSDK